MTPEADPAHLSRQVWQAVSDHAIRAVASRDFCPEQSRVENLRPVVCIDEDDLMYGRQIWCFEAMGITASGRRRVLYGLLEFSIQYGLLELSHSLLLEDASERERCVAQWTSPERREPSSLISTQFWVWAAWASVAILTGGWLVALCRYVFWTSRDLL
jgi:hypothetical protein